MYDINYAVLAAHRLLSDTPLFLQCLCRYLIVFCFFIPSDSLTCATSVW